MATMEFNLKSPAAANDNDEILSMNLSLSKAELQELAPATMVKVRRAVSALAKDLEKMRRQRTKGMTDALTFKFE